MARRRGECDDVATYRSVNLRLHLSSRGAAWTLVHRTSRGDSFRDRRLDMGMLRYASERDHPQEVIALLQRAVWDLARKHQISLPGGQSAPPPGDKGGKDPSTPYPHLYEGLPPIDTDSQWPIPGL